MRHTAAKPSESEDFAGPAVFLASDLSAYITGHIITADGGFRTV
jgi:enoyl-[acyl-carrier-protein] reductase (NADH)